MCMMRPPIKTSITPTKIKKQKAKPIKYDKEARMMPDPNFIDERKKDFASTKKSFWQSLFV